MSELDVIGVLRGHLERLERTLQHAHTASAARDLQSDASNMSTLPRYGKLTKALDEDLVRIRGYLTQEDTNVSDE